MTTHKMSFADARATRAEAKAQGLTTYHCRPCKRYGHTERYVSYGHCVGCSSKSSHKWREENPEKILESGLKYRQTHRDQRRKSTSKYAKENRGKRNALDAKRRAAKQQATPPWSLFGYHRDRIDETYFDSALFSWAFELPFEVDHEISLFNGGLHVYWNLQILIQSTNASKGTQDDAFVYPAPTFERITYRYNSGRVAL